MKATSPSAKTLHRWRSAGIMAIIVLGFAWHYIYAWTGSSRMVGWLVPVNESVWEHLKLGYWSLVLFSAVEYGYLKRNVSNYFTAKFAGILALELTILLVFYSYTFLLGKHLFWLDISSYLLGTIICQHVSHMLMSSPPLRKSVNRTSLAAFIAFGVLFAVATYYPPHVPIFKDHRSNTYGIHAVD